MPIVKADLPLPDDEAIKEGKVYEVLNVEPFTSDVQGFVGHRVTLSGGKDDLIAIALWERETAGRHSKLGSFMVALGKDTDRWVGQKVKFVSWRERNRQVEVV